ncbi:hypothetical protein ACIOGZ_24610 [Kitasatospora sp. NPDC088160]|uniref:hypothetical protein n=1 Tax=Kitasatospora sp. NPDC088160 TaxID=3364072 RepID=UPI0038267496
MADPVGDGWGVVGRGEAPGDDVDVDRGDDHTERDAAAVADQVVLVDPTFVILKAAKG